MISWVSDASDRHKFVRRMFILRDGKRAEALSVAA
jgi:hypothetical protein